MSPSRNGQVAKPATSAAPRDFAANRPTPGSQHKAFAASWLPSWLASLQPPPLACKHTLQGPAKRSPNLWQVPIDR